MISYSYDLLIPPNKVVSLEDRFPSEAPDYGKRGRLREQVRPFGLDVVCYDTYTEGKLLIYNPKTGESVSAMGMHNTLPNGEKVEKYEVTGYIRVLGDDIYGWDIRTAMIDLTDPEKTGRQLQALFGVKHA